MFPQQPYVLEFDHISEKGPKLAHISQMRKYKEAIVVAEMEKCDLRCANCHRIKTHRDKDHLRWMSKTKSRPL